MNPDCHVVKSEWFWNSIQIQERAERVLFHLCKTNNALFIFILSNFIYFYNYLEILTIIKLKKDVNLMLTVLLIYILEYDEILLII